MLVMANWKLNGSRSSNEALVTGLRELLGSHRGSRRVQSVICPPFPYLDQVARLLDGSGIELGGQDCSHSDSGAYTGETAADMLADCGCRWVIVGHSERRQYHRESDALIAAKMVAALRSGLIPVLCVGETQEQREAGEAERVVERQLLGALNDLPGDGELVVAYEPVWAIGTGLTATPELAQEMHATVRGVLKQLDERRGDKAAAKTRILYGGSVKADNAAQLFAEPDIDGALVGGASLDAASFAAIIEAAADA
jgi:triosephosphate isomerase